MFTILVLTLVLGNEITTPRIAPVAHPAYAHAVGMAATEETPLFAWSDARGIVISRDLQRDARVISPTGTDPDVAAGREGFLVTWSDANALFAMRLDVKGNPTGSAAKLIDDRISASHVVHSGDAYHVLFGEHVYRIPASGDLSATSEPTPTQPWTSIARRDQSFVLSGTYTEWVKGWCSVCEIPVYNVKSWLGEGALSTVARSQMHSRLPSSIGCNGSRCLSAWYDPIEGIGVSPGGPNAFFFRIHGGPSEITDQTSPIGIAQYDGDFIIAWQERTVFGDNDVMAAVVPYANPSNVTRFTIAATPRNERRPSVGMLKDGRIVIAYEVVDTDGSTYVAMRTLGTPGRRRTF